jgi:hypothetical protein
MESYSICSEHYRENSILHPYDGRLYRGIINRFNLGGASLLHVRQDKISTFQT